MATNPNILLSYFREAVKRVPILRYAWILIATVFIMAVALYFKQDNFEVFYYSLLVLAVSFFGFVLSFLTRTSDRYVRMALYAIVYTLAFVVCVTMLGFASFIVFDEPEFFARFFPRQVPEQRYSSSPDRLKEWSDAMVDDSAATADTANGMRQAIWLMQMGEDEGSIGVWDNLIDEHPQVALYYFHRSAALRRMGLLSDALRDLDRCVALAADYAPAYNDRGMLRLQLSQNEAGCRDLARAETLGSDLAGENRKRYCHAE